MASEQDVDRALAALATVYPQHFKQVANAALARQIYHRILIDINAVLLETAVMQWLSTARSFHPSPGELRDTALGLIERDDKSADEAWIEVIEAIRHIGHTGTPKWSNERITKTVKAFGWFEMCMTETDNMGVVRAQFMRIYQAQTDRRRSDLIMLPAVRDNLQSLNTRRAQELIGSTAKRLSSGGAK